MTRTPAFSAALSLVLLSLAVTSRADVVTTKDGLVLEGKATKTAAGEVVVTTDHEEVRLPAGSVLSIVPGEGPRAAATRAAAAVEKGDAAGHFRLALSLEVEGLLDLAKQEYEAVLAAEPDHPAARRALNFEKADGAWVTLAEARRRHGLVLYDGKWVLPAEVEAAAKARRRPAPKDADLVSAMKTAATAEGALAKAAAVRVAKAPAAERGEAATALLLHRDPRVRAWSCRELASIGDESCLRPLVVSAARDRDPKVRRAAIAAAASFGNDDLAIPFVRALWSEHPTLVANAAQALHALGDARSVRYLITRIESHGSSPRAYFSRVDQTSYISDFDVEVAQTSSIADPIIGTLQEGAVTDVQILDVAIEQTIVTQVLLDAFNGLAHAHAKNVEDVRAWAKEHAGSLSDFSQKPAPERAAGTASSTSDPAAK